jgi:hypothetical protein
MPLHTWIVTSAVVPFVVKDIVYQSSFAAVSPVNKVRAV